MDTSPASDPTRDRDDVPRVAELAARLQQLHASRLEQLRSGGGRDWLVARAEWARLFAQMAGPSDRDAALVARAPLWWLADDGTPRAIEEVRSPLLCRPLGSDAGGCP